MLTVAVAYIHLIATCFAVSTVLTLDMTLLRSLRRPIGMVGLARIGRGKSMVLWSLIALWVSGASLVALGYWDNGEAYLLNQKLWAKVAVVCALTLNGVVLHRVILPLLNPYLPVLAAPAKHLVAFGACGAVSSVGWLAAAFLGIARPLNHSAPFLSIMGGLLLVLAGAFAVVAITVARQKRLQVNSAPVVVAATRRAP